MKHILTTIAISFVTAFFTLTGVLWGLYCCPIPLSTKSLPDGTTQRTKYWLFRGVWEREVTGKGGLLMRSSEFYPDTPEQTFVTTYFYGVKPSRVQVETVPYPGLDQFRVYKPESKSLLASASIIRPTNGSEMQKQYLDADGTEISEEMYKAILTGH